jgi:hypothetical protein
MIRRRIILTLVLTLAVAGSCLIAAQSPANDLVYVTVKVTGAKKAPAPGLKAENFQVLEDKVEQKISFFAGQDGIWDINIILANSKLKPGRVDELSKEIRGAVDTFISTSNPLDKIKIDEVHTGVQTECLPPSITILWTFRKRQIPAGH